MSPRAAFDALAPTYDRDFTATVLGQQLRRRVWRRLAAHFAPGQHVLELACGTAADAVWLASRGVCVTAVDGSAQMLRVAQKKIDVSQMSHQAPQITLAQQSLAHLGFGPPTAPLFDGAFSNFGGLNTLREWRGLARQLGAWVRPGGVVILAPMGPWCPWEVIWHALHGQVGVALRRLRQPARANLGAGPLPIWYPAAARLRADFAPLFDHLSTESLGLWLPPSYLGHLVDRWPRLFARLNRLEQQTARLTGGWGDHYVIVFRRR